MGLLDEAIAEFQKALGSPTNRLPTYEALGQCFIEKDAVQAGVVDSRPRAERAGTRGSARGRAVSAGPVAPKRRAIADDALDLLSARVRARHSVPRRRRPHAAKWNGRPMSGVVARTRTPATSALREIQAPVRDRLEQVVGEMQRIVDRRSADHPRGQRAPAADARQDVSAHARAARERARSIAPSRASITLAAVGRAHASRHARARRLGRSLGAAARAADGELAVQPSGVRDHGRFPLLARADGARADGRSRDHEDRGRRRERADDRRDAAARRGRRAALHRRRVLSSHSREDGVADLRRVRERRAVRRGGISRPAGAVRRPAWAWRSRSPTTFSTTPRTSR